MKNDNGLFFLALAPAAAFLLHRLTRHAADRRNVRNRAAALPVSRKQLFRIALGPYIRRLLLFLAPLAILLAAACAARRIGPVTAAISFVLVASFCIFVCFPRLQAQYQPLAQLRNIPDFDEIFAGKQLHWLNGAWGYADDEWFIRVGSDHSVVLQSGKINFRRPVRSAYFHWKAPKFKGSVSENLIICRLLFTGLDGKPIPACTQTDSNILNWIQARGGKISQ